MNLLYETLDVFTSTRFGGNPLAVVFDADALSTERMQAVAREFNYSETTFVLAPDDPAHDARVRIFTPTFEMPFAGHPNVGTAYALAAREPGKTRFVFEEIAGLVAIAVAWDGDAVSNVEIAAPERLTTQETGSVEDIAAVTNVDAADIVTQVHPPIAASVGAAFTMVELASRDALRRVTVTDRAALTRLGGLAAVYAYTRDADDADIAARMIFDADGLVEDPATGSATLACAALIESLTGESGLTFVQGVEMGRPSRLVTRVEDGVAYVGGTCVPVMRGEITV